MKMISRYIRELRVAIICSLISSVSLLFSMLDVNDSKDFVFKIFASSLFWIGLIAEQIFIWKVNKFRKNMESKLSVRKIQGLPGICSFFKTESGFIADIVLILSFITCIVLAIGNWGVNVTQYIFIFLLVLSFRLHCILNGKNFRYKKIIAKRKVDKDE